MATRLNERQIRYVINSCKKGKSTSDIASELKVSRRHVQRLYAEFCRTSMPHTQRRPGRRPVPVTGVQTAAVLDIHKQHSMGVVYTARRVRETMQTSYQHVYRI